MEANRWPEVPDAIKKIAGMWHGGQSSELYAIASTGGLTFKDWFEKNRSFGEKAGLMAIRWYDLSRELVEPIEANELPAEYAALCERISEHLDGISLVTEEMDDME